MKWRAFAMFLLAACQADLPGASSSQTLGSVTPGDVRWDAGAAWTNGTIPYVIDGDGTLAMQYCGTKDLIPLLAPKPFAIAEALAEYEALTPIRFDVIDAAHLPADHHFLIYHATLGKSSSTLVRGMPLDNSPNCVALATHDTWEEAEYRRSVLHETGHALGFDHEQQRSDRKDYIDLNPTCLSEQDLEGNAYGIDPGSQLLGPYDYQSIMQYSSANHCKGCEDGCENPPMLKVSTCTDFTSPPGPGDCRWIETPLDLSVDDVNGFTRAYERALGTNQSGDGFGSTMVSGDFDGDGYRDLAIGAPNDAGGGAVYLWKGTGGVVRGELGRLAAWRRLSAADFSGATGGNFGSALAAGDFDGDKVTDLAIGAPGSDAGTVYLYHAVLGGPTTSIYARALVPWRAVTQAGLGRSSQPDDHFGAALAAIDLAATTPVSLLVAGAPRARSDSSGVASGKVLVIANLGTTPSVRMALTPSSLSGTSDVAGARFGSSLAARDLDGDSFADLAVGSPESGAVSGSGAVYLFVRRAAQLGFPTLSPLPSLRPASAPNGAQFGTTVAAGDFDGDGANNLAVGAPRWHGPGTATILDVGRVYVYRRNPAPLAQLSLVEQAQLATPSTHGGDRLGDVLYSARGVLYAGLPARNGGVGGAVTYSGLSGVLTEGMCGAGGHFGSAFVVNSLIFTGADQMAVGCSGQNPGGSFQLRTTADLNPWFWLTYTQESATPEL
jgi:hypothetical protein